MTDQHADHSFLASEDVSQFVGKNTAYYQGAWTQAALKAGSLSTLLQLNRPAAIRNRTAGWNWAAFFFSIGWLIYRKMYVWALGLLAAVFAIGAIEEFTGKDLRAVYLTVFVMAAYYGNAWYLGHTYKRVSEIQKATSDAGARKLLLGNAGGTNLVGSALGYLATALIVIALSVPELDTMLAESDQVASSTLATEATVTDTAPSLNPTRSTPPADEIPRSAVQEFLAKNQITASGDPVFPPLPAWESSLMDFNGVWQVEENTNLKVMFYPSYMAMQLGDGEVQKLEIHKIDNATDAVIFNISGKPVDSKWGLGRVRADDGTSLVALIFVTPDGSTVRTPFIRELNEDDLSAMIPK